jgi:hypothetical protein
MRRLPVRQACGVLLSVLGVLYAGCTEQIPTGASNHRVPSVGPQFSTTAGGSIPPAGTPGVSGTLYSAGPYTTSGSGEAAALDIVNLTNGGGAIYHQDPLTGQLFAEGALPPLHNFLTFQHPEARWCVFALIDGVEDPNDRGTCYRSRPLSLPSTDDYRAFWSGGVSKRAPSVRKTCSTLVGRVVCLPISDRPRLIIRSKPAVMGVRG